MSLIVDECEYVDTYEFLVKSLLRACANSIRKFFTHLTCEKDLSYEVIVYVHQGLLNMDTSDVYAEWLQVLNNINIDILDTFSQRHFTERDTITIVNNFENILQISQYFLNCLVTRIDGS